MSLIGNPMVPRAPRFAGLEAMRHHRRPRQIVRVPGIPGIQGEIVNNYLANNQGMPSKTKTATKRRQKKYRKGGKGRKKRIPSLWPKQQLVKFKQSIAMTSTPGVAGELKYHNILANTLAQPFGGSNLQLPLGLDTWAQMYRKYVVVGSTIHVRAHNLTSTGAVVYGITLRPPNETSALTSHEHYLETPRTVSRVLSPDMDHSGLTYKYKAKKYWNVKKLADRENLHGNLNPAGDGKPSAPTDTARFQLWSQDINITETHTLEYLVTLEFTVLLFDQIVPSRSTY